MLCMTSARCASNGRAIKAVFRQVDIDILLYWTFFHSIGASMQHLCAKQMKRRISS